MVAFTGIACTLCGEVFGDIASGLAHPDEKHDGVVKLTSCAVMVLPNDCGGTKVVRAYDDDLKATSSQFPSPPAESTKTKPTTTSAVDVQTVVELDDPFAAGDDLKDALWPSPLTESTKASSSSAEVVVAKPNDISRPPTMATKNTVPGPLSAEAQVPSNALPLSQQTNSTDSSSLSVSDELSLPSSQPTSSTPPSSPLPPTGSIQSQITTAHKLQRIYDFASEAVGQCLVCFHRGAQTDSRRPHYTYRCQDPLWVRGAVDYAKFKRQMRFPPNALCFYCYAPFAPPFQHILQSSSAANANCEFPDVLKEIAYIIFRDLTYRLQVFKRLRVSAPANLQAYARFLSRRHDGGLVGVHEVIYVYLELKDSRMDDDGTTMGL